MEGPWRWRSLGEALGENETHFFSFPPVGRVGQEVFRPNALRSIIEGDRVLGIFVNVDHLV